MLYIKVYNQVYFKFVKMINTVVKTLKEVLSRGTTKKFLLIFKKKKKNYQQNFIFNDRDSIFCNMAQI
jgi:hypothetical protein